MTILGIDPGTRRVGYGVIEKRNGDLAYLGAGLFSMHAATEHEGLRDIRRNMKALVDRFSPDIVAVEKLFFTRNQKTALRVAEARGALLLAAVDGGVRIEEFAPNEVKATVTGHGGADKRAVLKMVRIILKRPDLMVIDDASDALAVAICAAQRSVGRRAQGLLVHKPR